MNNIFKVHSSSGTITEYHNIVITKKEYIKNMTIWHKIAIYLVVIVHDDNEKAIADMDKHIENNSTVLFTK